MNELPPNPDEPEDVDDQYRRATALDPSRPSESVRRAVLAHAARLAAERAASTVSANGIGAGQGTAAAKIGAARRGAPQSWRRPAIFGTLAAAALAGLLIAPQYLPRRAIYLGISKNF